MKKIPYVDLRNSDNTALLKENKEKAIEIINASKDTLGLASQIISYAVLPLGDYIAKKWLTKNNNPYLKEINSYADTLNIKGVYALNLSYEWGCTAGAYQTNDTMKLARVLDWPFPSLGENIVVTHQQTDAGEYYNVTWPAVSGVFQAMAPGRFAASLNQAPMRRYINGVVIDWARNRVKMHKQESLPPAHLLRRVFEEAKTYAEAKRMLCDTPVSIPVIYTLTGINEGEGCVIERIEDDYYVREITNDRVCVANSFESPLNGRCGWMPRASDSFARSYAARCLDISEINEDLEWFKAPIAKNLSRLVMYADVKNNKLSVMGTNGTEVVTEIFKL